MLSTAERFNKTLQFYDQYRPSYPKEIITTLEKNFGLSEKSVIVDIGSGTGKLTELFLKKGCPVYAVEPNAGMRKIAEEKFCDYPLFCSLNGNAESIPLTNQQVDFITAAQAFHWFDPIKSRQEFRRILKVDGKVALMWNFRQKNASAFMSAYENLLLTYGKDYSKVAADNFDKRRVEDFFKPHRVEFYSFASVQKVSWEECLGRLESTSYALKPGENRYEEMIAVLKKSFEELEQQGLVEFLYHTEMYVGSLINP